jgi:HEAT repeat protein
MFVVALLAVMSGMGPFADGLEPPGPSAEPKLPGWRPYQDYVLASFDSSAEGVELLYKAIKEEMRAPTKSSQHDAHWMEHQSILGGLACGMGERARETRDGELKLRYLLAAEKDREVRDLLVVALGCFGDKTVWRDLVGIMKGKGRLVIREYAARALSECNARLAVPDLIEALKDTESVIQDVPSILSATMGGPTVR